MVETFEWVLRTSVAVKRTTKYRRLVSGKEHPEGRHREEKVAVAEENSFKSLIREKKMGGRQKR